MNSHSFPRERENECESARGSTRSEIQCPQANGSRNLRFACKPALGASARVVSGIIFFVSPAL
jgi:hypothetical protein